MKLSRSAIAFMLSASLFLLVLSGCGEVLETPKGLTVTSTNPITLTWTAPANATSYNVYRGTVSGGISTKTRIATDISTTSYTDSTAVGGTTYYYQITAKNDDGASGASNEVQATAAGGSFALVGNVSGNSVVLTWAAIPGASSYRIYRGTSESNLNVLPSGVITTSFSDTTVVTGTTYYYQVAAIDAASAELQRSNVTSILMP